MQRKSFSGDLTYEVRIRDGDYVLAKGCATSGCIHDLYVHEKYRRKGYATQMLRLALPACKALGLDRVLISCVEGNEGSKRTILRNGGVYESTVFEPGEGVYLERYWIDLRDQ